MFQGNNGRNFKAFTTAMSTSTSEQLYFTNGLSSSFLVCQFVAFQVLSLQSVEIARKGIRRQDRAFDSKSVHCLAHSCGEVAPII
jgi:hypothetical protein